MAPGLRACSLACQGSDEGWEYPTGPTKVGACKYILFTESSRVVEIKDD